MQGSLYRHKNFSETILRDDCPCCGLIKLKVVAKTGKSDVFHAAAYNTKINSLAESYRPGKEEEEPQLQSSRGQ
jgi:hypothetical protein